MLQTTNISFSYSNTTDFSFPNIELQNNEHLLILGESGIGKTTLLHLLAGILTPKKGEIVVNNENITNLNSKKLDVYRGKNIGLIFQKTVAISSLSVFENIEARLFFSKIADKKSSVLEILEQLDLTAVQHQKPNTLSQGQLQRLGIALGVIHQPKIILADEPTSSLDDKNCDLVIDLLKKQAEKANANLIIITHDQRIKKLFAKKLVL